MYEGSDGHVEKLELDAAEITIEQSGEMLPA